eukprot:scaffold196876_cov37-Tisochrysis_lutea.AAC.2
MTQVWSIPLHSFQMRNFDSPLAACLGSQRANGLYGMCAPCLLPSRLRRDISVNVQPASRGLECANSHWPAHLGGRDQPQRDSVRLALEHWQCKSIVTRVHHTTVCNTVDMEVVPERDKCVVIPFARVHKRGLPVHKIWDREVADACVKIHNGFMRARKASHSYAFSSVAGGEH